jgi:hypothetical protein
MLVRHTLYIPHHFRRACFNVTSKKPLHFFIIGAGTSLTLLCSISIPVELTTPKFQFQIKITTVSVNLLGSLPGLEGGIIGSILGLYERTCTPVQ